MAEVDARNLLAHTKSLSARYARQLGADEAADLVGEALARGLERPPADGRMGPWLERIVRNLVVDRWRRARVAARFDPEVHEPAPTPEELLILRERRRVVRGSLARLPRAQRRSIVARYYGGERPTETSSLATARTRLHRGLARLRALTDGLVGLMPPWRAFRWVTTVASPATVAVVLLAQQTPAAPPAPRPSPALTRPMQHRPAPAVKVAIPPAPAPAGSAAARRPAPTAESAPPPVQRYSFEEDQVAGELQAPTGSDVYGDPRRPRGPSLIEIPDSFAASIAKSVEDL